MSFVFPLPEIGEGVVEGEVVAWKVKEGDAVAVDQPLCEIMTDKATVEISSPKAGRVVKLYGKPGDIIKVHAPLAEIDPSAGGNAGGNGAGVAKPEPKAAPKAEAPKAPMAAAAAPQAHPMRGASTATIPPRSGLGPTKAPPAVRRHAREQQVDLTDVTGTGKGGRVTHADVDRIAAGPLPVAPAALPQVTVATEDQRVPIIGLRRKIAQQMVLSKQTAAHFTYVEEVDVTRLVEIRDRLKGAAERHGVKLNYLPFVAKACSLAFRDFPNVNAWMDSAANELIVKAEHHIGIATDTPQGLYVPVVRNVERKSILTLAAEIADVTARTRAGKASRDELSGSTFTITGVGQIGGVLATPILNLPEVGILGFNTIRDRALVVDGQIAVRKATWLSPTFDHRIVDGAVGARFTARLKEILENPEVLVLELA